MAELKKATTYTTAHVDCPYCGWIHDIDDKWHPVIVDCPDCGKTYEIIY